jgi:hypothetical protein
MQKLLTCMQINYEVNTLRVGNKINQLMPYRKTIAVCYDIHIKYVYGKLHISLTVPHVVYIYIFPTGF